MWPPDAASLLARQRELAGAVAQPWRPPEGGFPVGGCWVCFARGVSGPGSAGDRAWASAVVMRAGRGLERRVVTGSAGAPYVPGLLALRIGPLLEQAARALARPPDVLLVDATGRDHPRRAGLALQLGAELGMPTVGVTHRPLLASGAWPADRGGASSPLRIGDEVVAAWLRTRAGTRPLVVHAGWRTDLDTAVGLVLDATTGRRTPEPLRRARQAAREAREAGSSRS
ncbi:MAG: endonuclease V [Nocardioides sp.]